MFRDDFLEKFFAQCSMEGRVFKNLKKEKTFKIPKIPKIVPKSVQTCFEHYLGWRFPKKIVAQCFIEGRVFENFQKKVRPCKISTTTH